MRDTGVLLVKRVVVLVRRLLRVARDRVAAVGVMVRDWDASELEPDAELTNDIPVAAIVLEDSVADVPSCVVRVVSPAAGTICNPVAAAVRLVVLLVPKLLVVGLVVELVVVFVVVRVVDVVVSEELVVVVSDELVVRVVFGRIGCATGGCVAMTPMPPRPPL
ncbi:hypothetical protein DFJ74DRAFT_697135 [Hyaloraphidium curvatum]|nr:hypothetical protein DFJ74DRAFT_697135 [Hyaloraphidium curvatum]